MLLYLPPLEKETTLPSQIPDANNFALSKTTFYLEARKMRIIVHAECGMIVYSFYAYIDMTQQCNNNTNNKTHEKFAWHFVDSNLSSSIVLFGITYDA